MTEEHYQGGCQCGAVAYEVDVDIDIDIDNTFCCNCSRCKPMGFLLAFAPRAKFELKSGADNLTEYRFHKRKIEHLFCSTCGVESFALGATPDGGEMAAINVNCLDGVDPRDLDPKQVDGKSI